MFISEENLDDALQLLLPAVIENGVKVSSTKGENIELTGVLVEIANPRARLSRTETRGKPFSCLGELLWYLSGSDRLEFIEYYIPDYKKSAEENGTIHGGYGPRIFSQTETSQFENVRRLLERKPNTRQAVIQIFSGNDILSQKKDTPCTCTLQFLNRDERLHLIASMRSNDAFLGFPHDVFTFTMLQEIMAVSLGLELGTYRHFAGSMHIYEHKCNQAREFVDEGFQSTLTPMPNMPRENPREAIETLLGFERDVRVGKDVNPESPESLSLPEYWQDIARLLVCYRFHKDGKISELARSREFFRSEVYLDFVDRKIQALERIREFDSSTETNNA